MNLKRVRSVMLCVLPLCLPLLAACYAPIDENADPGDANVGDATQAATRAQAGTIAGGILGSVAVKADGTVWSCGYDGAGNNQLVPIQVSGLSGIIAVAEGSATPGGEDTLALKSDGTVYAWGSNNHGQLGDGTTTDRLTPAQVSGLSGVIAVVESIGSYALALKSDGTLWAWGYNFWGELGDGTTTDRATPVQVSGLSDVTAAAAAIYHTLAVKSDGTVYAWGINSLGQLGTGTLGGASATPVQVPGLSGVIAVAARGSYSMALKSDGTVWAWGDGQAAPAQVPGLSGITALAARGTHTLALKSDGTVYAWGQNTAGQIGDGTTIERATPVQVLGLSGVTAVAAGLNYSFAQKPDGTVYAWGYNAAGELGDGTTTWHTTPVQSLLSAGSATAPTISGGNGGSIAIASDGTVWSSGDNTFGQLGDGTTTESATPVQVSGLSGVVAVSEGETSYSLALQSDGTLFSWGHNLWGQLGDGTGTDRSTPVQVIGLSDIVAMSAADSHPLALQGDGTVWTWGINSSGQLGIDPSTYSRKTPAMVPGIAGARAVAGGNGYAIALGSDETVYAWGNNDHGQLGDGTATSRFTPMEVSGLSGITAVAAEYRTSLALRSDGTVHAWGANAHGQIGDGTTIGRSTPVQVTGLSDIKAVAEGYEFSLALRSDGTLYAWGSNGSGRLGDGTTTERHTPVQVHLPAGAFVTAIGAGRSHAFARTSDGTVYAWGENGAGQLGDATTIDRHTPAVSALP